MYFLLYIDQMKYCSLGKFGMINFRLMPGTMKIKHMKIFLPQRNRTVYNGL